MNAENEMERRIRLSDHGDGLADIFIGIFLIAFGLGMLSEMAWLGAIAAPLMFTVWLSTKTQIVLPRLEQAGRMQAMERGGKAFGRMTFLFAIALFLGIAFLAIFAFGNPEAGILTWLRSNFDLVFGVLLAVFLASFGAILGAARFYLYALLAAVIALTSVYFAVPLWITIAGIGSLTFLAGLLTLGDFLRRHPMDEGL